LSLKVHDHPTDQSCQWAPIFKPLSFIVFRDTHLTQKVLCESAIHRHQFNASDFQGYRRWLGEVDKKGVLNLVNVLLGVCSLRGYPQPQSVSMS
jgi:hypothetical protein